MQNAAVLVNAERADARPSQRAESYRLIRCVSGLAGLLCLCIASLFPWADFSSSGMSFRGFTVSPVLLLMFFLIILLAAGAGLLTFYRMMRQMSLRLQIGVVGVAILTCLSFAGAEYGYLRTDGISPYEYRGAARMLAYAMGIVLLASAVPTQVGARAANWLGDIRVTGRHVAVLAFAVVVIGALIGAIVLDGMPHMIDATTYLLQGRMFWSGHLALDVPQHVELFEHELLAFRESETGYFGKYPLGWPVVLGLFDAVSVPWLAAPVLAGLLVVLTYRVVLESSDNKRFAGLATLCVAACPWLWMNAGTMMSHVAAAVWLWTFVWLMLRARRTGSRAAALLSGLALGAAVMTRPADAAFFAMPCAAICLYWLARDPRRWATRLPLIVVGTLPGVICYKMLNGYLMGNSDMSPYGGGYASMLLLQMPSSPAHGLVWLQESWAGLSSQWFANAAPVGLLIGVGLAFGSKTLRSHRIVIAASLSLFLCYTIFVFGGRGWVGPRWYVPLIPMGAMLVAAGIEAAIAESRSPLQPARHLANGYLRALVIGGCVVACVVLPIRIIELIDRPPHGIDGRVVQAVHAAKLSSAVVALPESGLDPTTGQPNYKRGIAGMWAMCTPFEDSSVIYVVAIDGWQDMAARAWPERSLYEMSDRADDWSITHHQDTHVVRIPTGHE